MATAVNPTSKEALIASFNQPRTIQQGAIESVQDRFLTLLVSQMKNQDPTEPMDATQQMSQLATFSQVEQTVKTNKNLESLLRRTSLQEANSVIGRTVTSEDGKITGVVKEVTLYNDGIVAKLDSGKTLVIGPGVKISDGKSDTKT